MALSHIINYTAATKGDGSCLPPHSHRLCSRWVPVGIFGHVDSGSKRGFQRREMVVLHLPARDTSFTLSLSPKVHLLLSAASLLSAPKCCLSIRCLGTGVIHHTVTVVPQPMLTVPRIGEK